MPEKAEHKQKTIKQEVTFTGKGFIMDTQTEVVLAPAQENSGIYFIRTDISSDNIVEASPQNLRLTANCSTVEKGQARVMVIEHLMSACWALGITNLEVRINGREVPTFDGSAKPFVEFLQEAGICEQSATIPTLKLKYPVVVRENDEKMIVAIPSKKFTVGYLLKYPENPELGTDFLMLVADEAEFVKSILPARTFIPESEAIKLVEEGYIKSTDESLGVVVRAGDKPELRLPQEFVRHKILDMVGDLFILGKRIEAQFLGIMSGHKLNARMVKALSARYP